jgi:hypothetical protein
VHQLRLWLTLLHVLPCQQQRQQQLPLSPLPPLLLPLLLG